MKNIIKSFLSCFVITLVFLIFQAEVLASPTKQIRDNPSEDFWACHLKVHNPHHSAHEPENINVVAKFTCNSPVVQVDMIVQLARDGYIISTGHSFGSGVSAFKGNTSTPCVSGMYQGGAIVKVTFPPGSMPTSRTLHANSNQIYLTCP